MPLSHVAVLRHIDAMARGLQYQGSDISISCSPIHHEMGMLLGFLMPLVMGGTAVIMSPSHWFREPDFYLRAISDYRATMAWMPNVGFAVCTRRVRDEALARVDLNCLRVMGSASEPVRNNTIDAFTTRFAPWGLSPEAVTSAYGLAENVMLVSVTEPGVRPRVDWVLGRELHDAGCAKPVGPNSAGSVPVVSCGRPLPNSRIRIIDDDGHALDEREVGEVELSSDSLINDYLPELTEEDSGSQSGWFRTGDVGYLSDGELFLCDRRQDLIIVAGLKLLPRDVEQIAARVLGDRAGQCVAFGCLDNDLATERPVVVCEVSDSMAENLQAGLISQIRNATLYELNIGLKDLVLASPGWVVQLADGQPSRSDCRDKYLLGNSAKLPGGKAENPLMPVLDMSLTELLALPPDQRGITMTRKFCSLIEAVLNAPTGHVHADQTLAEAGVDSLSLIEVMIRLEQGLGVGLSLPGNEAQLRLGGLARHFLVLLERHQQRLARQGGADVMRGRYSGSTSHPHREKAGLGGVWQRLRGRR
ncbi:MAG: non-ribosomal peptide synthetase [Gammaproteobacteria bacterium]